MAEKSLLFFFSVVGATVVVCALFITWRLRRLNALKADAEQRAVAAFEEMNRLTKQLRERTDPKAREANVAAGARQQHLYTGVKRPEGEPGSS